MADGVAAVAAPVCAVCKDRRFVLYDVGPGHPQYGKAVPCPACRETEARGARLQTCGLPPEMQRLTLDHVVCHAGNAEAYKIAVAQVERPHRFLTLLGAPGVGKTTLLCALVLGALHNGFSARYATTASLLDGIRATYGDHAEADSEAHFNELVELRVLCLDEVDRYSPTPWAQEKFFRLINERYMRGADHLTCFASNAPLEQLDAYLQSRINDSQCYRFTLTGRDLRQRKR